MASKDDKADLNLKDIVLYAPLGLVYDYQKVVPQLVKRGKSQMQLGLFIGRMAANKGQSTAEKATADVLTTFATIAARGITEFGQVIGLAPPEDDAPPGPIVTAAAALSGQPLIDPSADPSEAPSANQPISTQLNTKRSSAKPANARRSAIGRSSGGKTATASSGKGSAKKKKKAGPKLAAAAPRLPIAGYDDLTAREIIELLGDLTPAQRTRVRDHETANRSRKTVLAKLDRLDD